MSALVEAVGLLAGGLTTTALFPQAIKTWRTRSSEGVSLLMYLIFTTGLLLWIVYGYFIGSTPIVIANLISFSLSSAILVMKLKFVRAERISTPNN